MDKSFCIREARQAVDILRQRLIPSLMGGDYLPAQTEQHLKDLKAAVSLISSQVLGKENLTAKSETKTTEVKKAKAKSNKTAKAANAEKTSSAQADMMK